MVLLFVLLGHMKTPILSIPEFHNELKDFYYSDINSHLKRNQVRINKPHAHDFYLCVIFTEGRGLHEIDFEEYSISPGTVFFLRPGQTHSWSFDTPPEGHIFFHSKDFFELLFPVDYLFSFPFFYSYHNKPFMVAEPSIVAKVDTLLKDVSVEFGQELIFRTPAVSSLINLVYIQLARGYMGGEQIDIQNKRNIQVVHLLEKKIEEFYREEKSVEFYAQSLNKSTRHLNRITRQTVGKTAKNLILDHILVKAKSLLVNSDKTVLEISEDLGFTDISYFSKFFKSKEFVSPKDFRTQY